MLSDDRKKGTPCQKKTIRRMMSNGTKHEAEETVVTLSQKSLKEKGMLDTKKAKSIAG